MDKGFNLFMIRAMSLDKLERMLLYHARNEHPFSRFCIKEAINNAKTAQQQPTRAQQEAEEALKEEL
jgi:predicted small metal-binding protein